MMPPLTTKRMFQSILALSLIVVCAQAAAQTGASAQDMAAANFRLADSNGDGVLSADEFVSFINLNAAQNIGQAKRVKSAGAYNRAFASVDKNGDGVVTPDELANSAG